jgi:hemolysin III
MFPDIPAEYSIDHYPSAQERLADLWIHVVSLGLAGGGACWLAGVAITSGRPGLAASASLYGVALTTMLALSAVYNLSRVSRVRPILRRLDEAGIFLMIAGSYTPFTSQTLHGAWAIGMTSLVWIIAAAGIVGKIAFPRISERVWTGVYVMFGWVAVMAIRPLADSLPAAVLVLLIIGGLLYTVGALLFLNRRLPFRRAIWHGFVLAAATLHFIAVAAGVIIPLRA